MRFFIASVAILIQRVQLCSPPPVGFIPERATQEPSHSQSVWDADEMAFALEDPAIVANDFELQDAKRKGLIIKDANFVPDQLRGFGIGPEKMFSSSVESMTDADLKYELHGIEEGTIHGVMHVYRPTFKGIGFFSEARPVVVMSDGMPSQMFAESFDKIEEKISIAAFAVDPIQSCLEAFAKDPDEEMKVLRNGMEMDSFDIWVTNKQEKFEKGREYRIEAADAHGEPIWGRCITSPSGNPIVALERQGANRGGNNLIGSYCFGATGCRYQALQYKKSGSICTLETIDGRFKTYNYNISRTSPATFQCGSDSTDGYTTTYVTGNTSCHWSHSSVNSLHHHAIKTVATLRSISNISYNEIQAGGIFKSYAHYGSDWNAFYDGAGFSYHNGRNGCVGPSLATCLDVVAHEMGHAVTRSNGNMFYSGPPGCLNEAFSDMMGDTIEKIVERWTDNDYLMGKYCKNSGFLRDMANPPRDGRSVDHTDRYTGQNVHYCSGIYNKAFHRMSQLFGADGSTKAFKIFLHANRFYFTRTVQWEQAACMVQKAATDLGYPTNAVRTAFSVVGITITENCNIASATPAPPANITAIPHCRWFTGDTIPGYSGPDRSKYYFRVFVPAGRQVSGFYLDSTTTTHDGDADLYVARNYYPSRTQYDKRGFNSNNRERIFLFNSRSGQYGIMLFGYEKFSRIKIGWCTFR